MRGRFALCQDIRRQVVERLRLNRQTAVATAVDGPTWKKRQRDGEDHRERGSLSPDTMDHWRRLIQAKRGVWTRRWLPTTG